MTNHEITSGDERRTTGARVAYIGSEVVLHSKPGTRAYIESTMPLARLRLHAQTPKQSKKVERGQGRSVAFLEIPKPNGSGYSLTGPPHRVLSPRATGLIQTKATSAPPEMYSYTHTVPK